MDSIIRELDDVRKSYSVVKDGGVLSETISIYNRITAFLSFLCTYRAVVQSKSYEKLIALLHDMSL